MGAGILPDGIESRRNLPDFKIRIRNKKAFLAQFESSMPHFFGNDLCCKILPEIPDQFYHLIIHSRTDTGKVERPHVKKQSIFPITCRYGISRSKEHTLSKALYRMEYWVGKNLFADTPLP